ncbi:ubiquitin carboxyl-terminal hydrolase 16 isoform X1 [Acyrthosiphon pisum]|uniref:ubiquitinyl hydrolase 1 n=2 Tax=Acyrthosiphon pisum TaxID=7029 RepID=A0A8R2A589_ACYPI|nr:ubiquitin carboxyl-terminal hydrolase 16 isoform X1 [Acyrthosiphon pisum]XP_008178717.1 ubiquitin carboxyl-terminal hydrolase 16 isoform X1 [Acyrthosiphon pisum]|eukprot:XP_003241597.1 PREDICTED: ubiquitin carboxyl-terminal hydrolase 16 isoform X1 [Acyrthosiphon pisum]
MAKGKNKKRNRQSSNAPVPLNAGDSSDSGELKSQPTNILKHPCTHVKKAVNVNNVNKCLQKVVSQCSECKNSNLEELYICIQCGSFHCSNLEINHILKHQNTPRSDSHSIAVNIGSLIILCNDCKKEISVTSSKKLQVIINSINHMKQVQTGKNKMNDLPIQGCSTEADAQYDKLISESSPKKCNGVNKSDDDDAPSLKKTFDPSENITNNVERCKRPRGLTNLGNTCFYNSVLQCLAQTPFLRKFLLDISESGEPMTIKLDNEDITVHQEKWSSLTENLYTTLQEITNERESTFTPSALLDSLRKKCKMFIGYSQHDSHELLRHLLDSVRDDDLKRYKKTIVHHYGLSMKVEPSEVDEKKTAKIKELGKKLQDVLLRPDHVFKGELLSVVQCQTCGYKSEVTESFLDLSLPITVDKTHPLSFPRKKDNDVFSQSKHQTKKERKLALKQGRRKKHEQKQFNNKMQDTLAVNNDADIEDNMEIETNEIEMSIWKNENKENPESGYGSEKQPSNVTSPSLSITELTTLMNNTPLADPDRQMDADQILDSEKPMDLDSVLPGSPANSPSSPQGSSLDSMRANVSPDYMDVGTDSANENPERNNPTPNVSDNNSDGLFDDSKSEEDVEDEEEGEFSQECPQATLQPQLKCKDSECSVLTCLNQFTASEIMTGNNKVSCERCTEQHKKKTNEEKTIYRQSTKQMLISSPPAILILHLKRFQMCYSTTRKMTRDVSFQWVLDIAPYCSVKCQNKLSPGQNRILYSLYGVVEHNGFLHSGHYLSYVKVRDPVKDDSYRYSFLEGSKTKPPKVIDGNDDPSHLAPSGTWYCVSDSMVRQVTPNVVQNCQAYLLFYERIL